MKLTRVFTFLFSLVAAGAYAAMAANPVAIAAAAAFVWLVGNMLGTPGARLCATLTVNEIMQDTLDAFKSLLPMLSAWSTNFSSATARKGDTVTAHIAGLPAVQDYDATSGYELNQVEGDSLISDVAVTLDQLKHVPVRVKYLTELSSKKNLYRIAIANQAYVLGKAVVDAALAKITDANVTHDKVASIANTTYDTVEQVRTLLNGQKADTMGRWGILNSSAAGALQVDSRIASRDYYGQLNGGSGYRTFANVAGFPNIWEYPDLPTNGVNLSGVFGDRKLVTIATRLPDIQSDIAAVLGIPQIANFQTVTDPESGLSLLGIQWQKQGTFDVWLTVALLFGTSVGTRGGAADSGTDKSGVKLVTA